MYIQSAVFSPFITIHRQELDLFSIQGEAGGGLVFWHPKGARMRLLIEDYWRSAHTVAGYDLLYTPHVANLELWKTSGHVDFYQENMFEPIEVEAQQYQRRPRFPAPTICYCTEIWMFLYCRRCRRGGER